MDAATQRPSCWRSRQLAFALTCENDTTVPSRRNKAHRILVPSGRDKHGSRPLFVSICSRPLRLSIDKHSIGRFHGRQPSEIRAPHRIVHRVFFSDGLGRFRWHRRGDFSAVIFGVCANEPAARSEAQFIGRGSSIRSETTLERGVRTSRQDQGYEEDCGAHATSIGG